VIVHRTPGALPVVVLVVLCVGSAACGAAPTPAPPTAPPPTRSPVQASPNPNLVAFEQRLRDASSREGQLVRSLSAAAGSGSNAQLELAARQLAAWAIDEQAWLEDNVADTCYEDAWQTYASALDDIGAAATQFRELAGKPSPPSNEQAESAVQRLGDGGGSMQAAADLATKARAACR